MTVQEEVYIVFLYGFIQWGKQELSYNKTRFGSGKITEYDYGEGTRGLTFNHIG
jgi:hypothetical protein